MSYLFDLLKSLFGKDQAALIDVKDNEINRLREDLKEQRDMNTYIKVLLIIAVFWASVATLAAVEIGIHS